MHKLRRLIFIPVAVLILGYGGVAGVFARPEFVEGAQTSGSVLYVPLIGITSVPDPLALPTGGGSVTYKYAVKNFLREVPLTDIRVFDDECDSVKFNEGDDNNDSKLDFSETWRYSCTTKLSKTTESTATVTGVGNGITATHHAQVTVVVGSNIQPPIVNIINVTKVAYPLSLPAEGGKITFTYKVNNPGVVPLRNVVVTDDKCLTMSSKLGDTNGNNLLDINEVWLYTCTASLNQTTTNTVYVSAYANGLQAFGRAVLTVKVETPNFPTVGTNPKLSDTETNFYFKSIVWMILLGILIILALFFLLTEKNKKGKIQKMVNFLKK